MSAIEIIEIASHPGTTADQLQEALDALDAELIAIGGFQPKELFREADGDDRWLLMYLRIYTLKRNSTTSPSAIT